MSMENVLAQMKQTKDELLAEVASIDRMMMVYAERHPEIVEPKPLTNDRRRASAGGKATPKRLETTTPNKKKKSEYAASEAVINEIKAAIAGLYEQGTSFVESIPGSFTTRQIAEISGRNEGTVRKGLKQLQKEGFINKAERLGWRQLGDTPRGATDVFVLGTNAQQGGTEVEPARGWRREQAVEAGNNN